MKKIFLFFFIGIFSILSQENNNRGYIVNVGEKSPNFHLEIGPNENWDITPINNMFLEEFQDKVIMLQFTASWCSVCIKEMPVIEEEIWQKYKSNEDFILLALTKDTDTRPQREQEIELLIDKTGITYPIITDYNSLIFNMFAEKKAGVTRNIIINKNGEIAFLTRLFDHNEFNEMKTVIDKLLKKKH